MEVSLKAYYTATDLVPDPASVSESQQVTYSKSQIGHDGFTTKNTPVGNRDVQEALDETST